MDAQAFAAAKEVYAKTDDPGMCCRAGSDCQPSWKATHYVVELPKKEGGVYRATVRIEDQLSQFPDLGEGNFSPYCEWHAEIAQRQKESLALEPDPPPIDTFPAGLMPENLLDTVSKLSGPGFAKLRSQLSGQFGIRLESTGARQSSALTRIIFQTLDASPENPYLVEFNQFILDPFTGAGQFDLVERDSSDVDIFDDEGAQVSGGESEVTLATNSGFTDGTTTGVWSRLAKVLTSDKVYIVVFVPGDDAGDGFYSISVRALYPFLGEGQ